jgi:hypothetical protein
MIWQVPCGARNSRKKESFLFNSLRCDRLIRFSIEHDVDRARVRTKHTNLQIVPNAVRTQDAKRIGMYSPDEAAHLITRNSGNLEGFHTFSCTFEAVKRIASRCNVASHKWSNAPAACESYRKEDTTATTKVVKVIELMSRSPKR